jgi:ribosomal protein S18 acetylase RimI-like enzyme
MFNHRDALPADIPALVNLLQQLYTLEPQFSPNPTKQKKGLEMCLNSPQLCKIVVLERDGEVIGMANLQFCVSTASGAMAVHIDDFIVHENQRGKGGGKALMEACVKTAEEIKAASISLNVDVTNHPALAFYKKSGFVNINLIRYRRFLDA